MATNASLIRKPTDRSLYMIAAIGFPLIVFIGYFKSYYFSSFFPDSLPIANKLVHAHGIIMSAWVLFFALQSFLVRTKNIKLHISLGMAGIALATLCIISGVLTAYDAQLVRRASPPGTDPHSFFIVPVGDMVLFAIYFAAAIYYRKSPTAHKSLMLMTAINFTPAALFRIPVLPPENMFWFALPATLLIGISCLIWMRIKHGKFNYVFGSALLLFFVSLPGRLAFAETTLWHRFTNWLIT